MKIVLYPIQFFLLILFCIGFSFKVQAQWEAPSYSGARPSTYVPKVDIKRVSSMREGETSWMPQSSGTTETLRAVYFTDANTGYVTGENGTILKTNNGGATWMAQSSGTTEVLAAVYFTDPNTGYITGENGTILKTTNGGTNWTTQSSGTTDWLSAVFFTSTNVGYATGENGTILKTTNGGTNWTTQSSGTTDWLYGVYFTGVNTGYIAGDNGTILRTTNGGTTWTAQPSGTTRLLVPIHFSDANTGYAAGVFGTLLKTVNGGTTWTELDAGFGGIIRSISFTSNNTGYIVGDTGTILETKDGGATWVMQDAGTTQRLFGVHFVDANTGYVVGRDGIILKYSLFNPEINLKQNTTTIASGETYDFGRVIGNVASEEVTFTIENTGDGDLAVLGVTLSGVDADRFSVSQPTSPITAGGSQTFSVAFSPGSTGVKEATLTIASNDSDESSYIVNLTGTGNVLSVTSIEEPNTPEFVIYPNPTTDKVKIVAPSSDRFIVIDSKGNEIFSEQVNQTTMLDLSKLPAGIYHVILYTNTGSVTKKMLKR